MNHFESIAETNEFQKRASKLIDDAERMNIISFLAQNPTAGVVIPGSGGLRKLRWQRKDRGKRGGVRIIYFYYNTSTPLYLLTIFSKSEQVDLSKNDLATLKKYTNTLVSIWKEHQYEQLS